MSEVAQNYTDQSKAGIESIVDTNANGLTIDELITQAEVDGVDNQELRDIYERYQSEKDKAEFKEEAKDKVKEFMGVVGRDLLTSGIKIGPEIIGSPEKFQEFLTNIFKFAGFKNVETISEMVPRLKKALGTDIKLQNYNFVIKTRPDGGLMIVSDLKDGAERKGALEDDSYLKGVSNAKIEGELVYTKTIPEIVKSETNAKAKVETHSTVPNNKANEAIETKEVQVSKLDSAKAYYKRIGATPDSIKEIQNALLKAGYELKKYGADGGFGKESFDAIIQFQKDKGLEQDGKVGSKTLSVLKGYMSINTDVPKKEEADKAGITEDVSEGFTSFIEWLKELFKQDPEITSFVGDNGETIGVDYNELDHSISLDTSFLDNVSDSEFKIPKLPKNIKTEAEAKEFVQSRIKKLEDLYNKHVFENALESTTNADKALSKTLSTITLPDSTVIDIDLVTSFNKDISKGKNIKKVVVKVDTTFSDNINDSEVSVVINDSSNDVEIKSAIVRVEADYKKLYLERNKIEKDGDKEELSEKDIIASINHKKRVKKLNIHSVNFTKEEQEYIDAQNEKEKQEQEKKDKEAKEQQEEEKRAKENDPLKSEIIKIAKGKYEGDDITVDFKMENGYLVLDSGVFDPGTDKQIVFDTKNISVQKKVLITRYKEEVEGIKDNK